MGNGSTSIFPQGRDSWIKVAGNLIVLIMFVGGIVAWAFNQHSNMREKAIDEMYRIRQDTKVEYRRYVDDKCVPIKDFAAEQQKLKDALEEIDRLRRHSHNHRRPR